MRKSPRTLTGIIFPSLCYFLLTVHHTLFVDNWRLRWIHNLSVLLLMRYRWKI